MKVRKPGKLQRILQKLSQLVATKAVSGKGHTNPETLVLQFKGKQHPQILNIHWELLPAPCIICEPALQYIEKITTKSPIRTGLYNIPVIICLVAVSVKTSSSLGEKAAGVKNQQIHIVLTPGKAKSLLGG